MDEGIGERLDVIISLLARRTIGVEEITRLVTSGKRKGSPEDFLRAYNLLGEKTITELASLIGITKQALSSVIKTWERNGIIYNIGSPSQPKYKGVIKLPESDTSKKSETDSAIQEEELNSSNDHDLNV
jgi:hypothetical protein